MRVEFVNPKKRYRTKRTQDRECRVYVASTMLRFTHPTSLASMISNFENPYRGGTRQFHVQDYEHEERQTPFARIPMYLKDKKRAPKVLVALKEAARLWPLDKLSSYLFVTEIPDEPAKPEPEHFSSTATRPPGFSPCD